MATIDVYGEGVRFPHKHISKKKIRDMASAAAGLLSLGNARITVVVTDDAYIAEINKQYRRHDGPTDVISFPTRENPFPAAVGAGEEIGDIYLSIERAAAQALEYRVALADELKRLIVHGILHLVGYDHERSKNDEKIMARKEKELYDSITV